MRLLRAKPGFINTVRHEADGVARTLLFSAFFVVGLASADFEAVEIQYSHKLIAAARAR